MDGQNGPHYPSGITAVGILLSDGRIVPHGGPASSSGGMGYGSRVPSLNRNVTERADESRHAYLDLGLNIRDKVTRYRQPIATLDEIILDRIQGQKPITAENKQTVPNEFDEFGEISPDKGLPTEEVKAAATVTNNETNIALINSLDDFIEDEHEFEEYKTPGIPPEKKASTEIRRDPGTQRKPLIEGARPMNLFNEYQIMPYIDADKKQFETKEIKKLFKEVQEFANPIFTSSTTPDGKCTVVQCEDYCSYECIDISHNRVMLNNLKKKNESYNNLLRFAFSTCKRFFIQENGEQFSIVDLGEFEHFFSPSYNLCEDQKDNFFEIGPSKRKIVKRQEGDEEGKEYYEPEEGQEPETIQYSFSNILVSSENHLFFSARQDNGDYMFFGSKEKIPKLHEQLMKLPIDSESQARSIDFLNEDVWEKYPIKKDEKNDYGYKEITRQSGSNFFHIKEREHVSKLFDMKAKAVYEVKHDEEVSKITDSSDISSYVDRFGRLFYKANGIIAIYSCSTYQNCFELDSKIELEKNNPVRYNKICKVYENYIYFYNEVQGDSLYILNHENPKEEKPIGYKIDRIAEFKFQNGTHPYVLSEMGVYNVFLPAPLCSRHHPSQDNDYISSGVAVQSLEDVREYCSKELDREYAIPELVQSSTLIDFIPEAFVALVCVEKQEKRKNDKEEEEEYTRYYLYILQFTGGKSSEPLLVEVKDPKRIFSVYPRFMTRVITKVKFYTGREQQVAQILVRSEESRYIKEKEEYMYDYVYAIVSVPLDSIQQNQLNLIATFKDAKDSQGLFCKIRNELLINVTTKVDKKDQNICYMYQLYPKDNILALKRGSPIKIDFVPKIFLFSDRKIYCSDPTTDAFEIKQLVLKNHQFVLTTLAKYPTLKQVYLVFQMRKCVLINLVSDQLYITNPEGTAIKATIMNLFYGRSWQDRSNINDIYFYNQNAYHNSYYTWRLNLFNNSPFSIPHQILIREHVFSEYNHTSRTISYKENMEATENLSQMKVRSYFDQHLDFQHSKRYDDCSDELLASQENLEEDYVKKPLLDPSNPDKHYKKSREFLFTSEDVIQRFRDQSALELMSYNIMHRLTFLFSAVNYGKTDIVTKLMNTLENLKQEDVPFLFPEINKKEKSTSAFDIAINKNGMRSVVQNLFDVMVNCDPKGQLYQEILERNIDNFVLYKINLKNFFASSMPIYKNFDSFPQFHQSPASLFLPLNFHHNQTIGEVNNRYKELINTPLEEGERLRSIIYATRKWFKSLTCTKRYCCIGCGGQKSKVQEQKELLKRKADQEALRLKTAREKEKLEEEKSNPLEEQKIEEKDKNLPVEQEVKIAEKTQVKAPLIAPAVQHETTVDELHEIEYCIVNMPGLISQNPRRFMLLIKEASDKDITFLEIPVIQMVINFKWKQYTEGFFLWQFYKLIIFILSFMADIITISDDLAEKMESDKTGLWLSNIITRSVCGLMMVDHFLYEMKQMLAANEENKSTTQKLVDYLSKDFWNIFDQLIIFLYIAYIPCSFIYEPTTYLIKTLQCAILGLFMIKFNFYLRIFDRFGFLVQMIVNVFYDLRYFLFYFSIILSFFSIMVSIITADVPDHDGIGPVKFFMMTLRTSLGDNDIDQDFSEFKILFWIIWIFIVIVGNIVLMNFIIAVVGESYNKCMEKRIAQTYKVKVDLIVERENLLPAEKFKNKLLFPSYILVRQLKDNDLEAAEAEANRDANIQKEIKRIGEIVDQLKLDAKPEIINKLMIEELQKVKPEILKQYADIYEKMEAITKHFDAVKEKKEKARQLARETRRAKKAQEREEEEKLKEVQNQVKKGVQSVMGKIPDFKKAAQPVDLAQAENEPLGEALPADQVDPSLRKENARTEDEPNPPQLSETKEENL